MIDTLEFLVYFGYYVFVFTLAWMIMSEWELVMRFPKIQLRMLFWGLFCTFASGILLWVFK